MKLESQCPVCKKSFLKRRASHKYCGRTCQWKGRLLSEPSYFTIHEWSRTHYKKSGICQFCKKKQPTKGKKSPTQWALKKGCEYKRDIKYFIELCVTCHINYDMTDERRKKVSLSKKGIKPSASHRRNLTLGQLRRWKNYRDSKNKS